MPGKPAKRYLVKKFERAGQTFVKSTGFRNPVIESSAAKNTILKNAGPARSALADPYYNKVHGALSSAPLTAKFPLKVGNITYIYEKTKHGDYRQVEVRRRPQ